MNGLNLRVTIWHISNDADDVVAGAMLTGTPAYVDVPMRLEEQRVTQVVLEQGFEVPKLIDATTSTRVIIHERDEVEVTFPPEHRLFGQRLRVMAVQYDSLMGRIAHQELVLRKVNP